MSNAKILGIWIRLGIGIFPIRAFCQVDQLDRQMCLFISFEREELHFYCNYGQILSFPQPTPRQSSNPLMGLQHWGRKTTIVEIYELATWLEALGSDDSKNVFLGVLDPIGHMPKPINCDSGYRANKIDFDLQLSPQLLSKSFES